MKSRNTSADSIVANWSVDCAPCSNIGFVATRIAGTDGVSLETLKWASTLEKHGFNCFYLAGELDTPPEKSRPVQRAHFRHEDITEIYKSCFGRRRRERFVTSKISGIKEELKDHLYNFIDEFSIDLLITENSITIPLNLPLGIAIAEVASETGIRTIAHHHDFFWERTHFLTNAVWEYLNMAFPPHLPNIRHVVISSSADNQLSLRTGISATLIPNVMDFENPPPQPDEYASDVRRELGIREDEYFILQPTRVVKRKGIEHAVELVKRLDMKARLVITHSAGDEGYDYAERIRDYARLLGVDIVFAARRVDEKRGLTEEGEKIYTLADIYPFADLVTYPSTYEGFGNAFLEAVYHKKPLLINTYSIYSVDIRPKGFAVIEMPGFITPMVIENTRNLLKDPELREKMVEHNYNTARRFYSYSVLEQKLYAVMNEVTPLVTPET
ncbi:MAG: glycosyltransferase [Desulfobacterales bacterium]